MNYEINFNDIKKNYIKKESLQHNAGSKFTILPYNTQFKESKRPELLNFISAVGEFSRRITNFEEVKEFSIDDYMNKIIGEVEMNKKDTSIFTHLIKELFFDEDTLSIFHPKTFNYISSTSFNKKLGQFLFDVLYLEDEEVKILIDSCYDKEPNNILLKLMVSKLKPLSNNKYKNIQYKNMIPYVSEIFMEDLKFILTDYELLTNNLKKLLKFYYIFYTSQLAMVLNKTFEADIENPMDIYFALDWENTSKGRLSTEQGWNVVESNVLKFFSHANTLDLVNHNYENSQYSYVELKHRIDKFTPDEELIFIEDINKLIEFYQEYIKDVEWDKFKYFVEFNNPCYEVVNRLYKSINHQFNVSGRKERQKDYGTWFIEFCKDTFLRQRGRYGYVFNLTEEYTIFLTKICIKNNEKIKVKDLFNEFKKRGISLDSDSKIKVIQLYEKLNILEKKSDSGDAQYVKSIL